MSDDKNLKLVGPPERPIEAAKGRLTAVEQELDDLSSRIAQSWANLGQQLDRSFDEVWQVLATMNALQGALVEAVQSMAKHPAQPYTGAREASAIIDEALEAAYGPDEGSADDGVVPDAAGDQTGDS